MAGHLFGAPLLAQQARYSRQLCLPKLQVAPRPPPPRMRPLMRLSGSGSHRRRERSYAAPLARSCFGVARALVRSLAGCPLRRAAIKKRSSARSCWWSMPTLLLPQFPQNRDSSPPPTTTFIVLHLLCESAHTKTLSRSCYRCTRSKASASNGEDSQRRSRPTNRLPQPDTNLGRRSGR